MADPVTEARADAAATIADYEAQTWDDLRIEISDDYMGETGDLIRQHAHMVLWLRAILPALAAAEADRDRAQARADEVVANANRVLAEERDWHGRTAEHADSLQRQLDSTERQMREYAEANDRLLRQRNEVQQQLDDTRRRLDAVNDELAEWDTAVEEDGSPAIAPVQGMVVLMRARLASPVTESRNEQQCVHGSSEAHDFDGELCLGPDLDYAVEPSRNEGDRDG